MPKRRDTCYSGGADGADLAWGAAALKAGQRVKHYSFYGHQFNQPGSKRVELGDELLARADKRLERANKALGRRVPYSNYYVLFLLRRNWWQVRKTERLYAITTLERGKVAGGTAWAVQMFIDRFKGKPLECYVFEQNRGQWYVWRDGWQPMLGRPPRPHGRWTGIGTRELNPEGEREIYILF